MPRPALLRPTGFAALLLVLAAPAGAAPAPEKVGVAAAVNPAAQGEPPGEAVRTLTVGSDIIYNERIQTSSQGQTQILFLDRSSFSVGPDSDIVIDEFVYDRGSGTGKLVATATKGVFRFVGGALSKNNGAVTLKTPSATIGVRGGMIGVKIGGGDTSVIKYFGDEVALTTPSGTQRIFRNDYFQTVNPQGVFAFGQPRPAPRELQLAMAAPLDPLPGSSGGAKERPGDAAVGLVSPGNSKNVIAADAAANSRQPKLQMAAMQLPNFPERNTLPVPALSPASAGITQPMVVTVGAPGNNSGSNPFIDVGGTGLIRGQLVWNVASDLDLHLVLPNSAGEVSFAKKMITFNNGGAVAKLDKDNLGDHIDAGTDQRIENIVVTGSNIPAGTYLFYVFNFSGGRTSYVLNATGDGGASFLQQIQTILGSTSGPRLGVVSPGGRG